MSEHGRRCLLGDVMLIKVWSRVLVGVGVTRKSVKDSGGIAVGKGVGKRIGKGIGNGIGTKKSDSLSV